MSSVLENNKAVVRRLVEAFINTGDVRTAEELLDDQYTWLPVSDDKPMSKEVHIRDIPDLRTIFGDLTYTIKNQVAEGDLVVTHGTMRGTHTGTMKTPFGTFAPTNKTVAWDTISFHRMRNGKVLEGWVIYNPLDALQQLGFVKQWPEGYGSARPRQTAEETATKPAQVGA